MRTTQKYIDDITFEVIGSAIEVHKALGPGLLESVYHKFFKRELQIRNLDFKTEQQIEISYKGESLQTKLRYDFLVQDVLVVELKSVKTILPIHEAQLLTYMKLLKKGKGIVINFNCTNIFQNGQKTMVNDIYFDLHVA